MIRTFCTMLTAATLAAAPGFAQDAEPGGFNLELNAAADTTAGACRLTYVASNNSDTALDRTAYEVAVFDAQGVVQRLLVLEFGALVSGKTKILQFDLAETPCNTISRIVVNDAAACTQAGSTDSLPLCMEGLSAASRTAIQFGI
jgi:hypothetical protein